MASVVLVTGDFVPTGGMDRANYALAAYLARIGHAVKLVTHRAAPELASLPNVTVQSVRKPLNSYLIGSWWLNAAGKRASREPNARTLVNGGNCLVADANWVHYVHAAYTPTVAGSVPRRLKASLELPLNRTAERQALQMARVIIANSERTRRELVERLKIPCKRIHVVYYGIDTERFAPASDIERRILRERLGWPAERPVVLFIGALGDRRKGFDTLFAAWAKLARTDGWDAILGVVGQGAERAAWEERVAAEELTDSIRFLGFRSDVPDLLRAADALVAPTRYEAYGLGVHEALCCGLPAIVSADSGVAERYPAELHDLLLPNADDASDLAARLERWHRDRIATALRVQPFTQTLRAWTWDDMARSIWEKIA